MDRDYLIDLAISIAQDCADEWHSKENIAGMETELSSVDKETMPALHEKLTDDIAEATEEWLDGVKLRRFKMDVLGIKSPAYDYHKRCALKHRATSFVTAVETYQADPDELTKKAMEWSEKRFWKALCKFMGVKELTDCGRCLSDQLSLIHAKENAKKNGYELEYGKNSESL